MALFPFILIKHRHYRRDNILIHHEKIHLRQQIELLLVFFYLLYLLHYALNLIKFRNHYLAYINIVFEKEAYAMDGDLEYLRKRRFWEWARYW
jgi:hypothetical protein